MANKAGIFIRDPESCKNRGANPESREMAVFGNKRRNRPLASPGTAIRNRKTAPIVRECLLQALIGCPKLDDCDYSEKLTEIIAANDIKSVTLVRMEVPCCGGLEQAAIKALKNSGKFIPWQVVTISIDGKILE